MRLELLGFFISQWRDTSSTACLSRAARGLISISLGFCATDARILRKIDTECLEDCRNCLNKIRDFPSAISSIPQVRARCGGCNRRDPQPLTVLRLFDSSFDTVLCYMHSHFISSLSPTSCSSIFSPISLPPTSIRRMKQLKQHLSLSGSRLHRIPSSVIKCPSRIPPKHTLKTARNYTTRPPVVPL